MTPRISVVIPAFNRSATLREALDSVAAQTAAPGLFEVVVSDDASTDDTWKVIQAYRERLPNLRAVRQESNLGGARNWEFLLTQARGELVFLLSHDDAVEKTFIARFLALFDSTPGLDMATAALELRGPRMEFLARQPLATPEGATDGRVRVREQLRSHHLVMSTVYRRAVLVSAGGWDPRVGTHVDCTAYCRAALRSRATYYLAEPLLRFRISPGTWGAFAPGAQRQAALWYRKKLDLLSEDIRGIAPEMASWMRTMYAWHARTVLHAMEVHLAHRQLTGGEARGAMRDLLEVFPEARRDRMAWKLTLASYFGTRWLTLLRRALGKPDPYDSTIALFGRHSREAPREAVRA